LRIGTSKNDVRKEWRRKECKVLKNRALPAVLFLIIISVLIYKYVGVKQELKENLVNEPPIVFSASMSGYGDGTYLYHLGSDTIDKISEETFDELTYNKDKTRLIVKVKNNDFSGIAEYDWKKAEFIPIISIEEIQRSVGRSELHNDITGLNCFGGGYLFWYDGICLLEKEDTKWKVRKLYREQGIDDMAFVWNPVSEILYFTGFQYEGGNFKRYDIKTDKVSPVLEDRAYAFDVSADGKKIMYHNDKGCFMYDTHEEKQRKLFKLKGYKYIEKILISQDSRYGLCSYRSSEIISTDSIFKFCVTDLKTGKTYKIKDWDTTIGIIYSMDW